MKRALAAGLLVLSLSACGAGTARGDIAAKVGSRTISVDEVADIVEAGLRDQQWAAQVGDNRAAYQRQVLDRMLRNALQDEVARRLGVTVTADEVRRERERQEKLSVEETRKPLVDAAADAGYPEIELDTEIRAALLNARVVDKLVPEPLTPQQVRQYDAAQVEHIVVPDARRANEILAQLRAGANFAALAKRFSTDEQTKDNGGRLPTVQRGQLEPVLDRAAFEGPLNAFQGPIRSRFGFEVLRVLQRQITKPGDVPPEIKRQIQAPIANGRLREQTDKVIADLGLEVNPRFGTWDGTGLAPAADDVSTPPTTPPAVPGGGPGGSPGDPNQPPPQGDPNQPPPQGEQPTAPPAG